MPTYEYACTSCGFEWEAEQSIKDAPLSECPTCKNATAKRQISRGTGFILKGGGWYSDLYASPKTSGGGSGSGGSGSGGGSGSSGSSGDAGGGAGGSSSSGGSSSEGGSTASSTTAS